MSIEEIREKQEHRTISTKWYDIEIRELLAEIERLTKERDEFIKTIAELGKMNQELRERLNKAPDAQFKGTITGYGTF